MDRSSVRFAGLLRLPGWARWPLALLSALFALAWTPTLVPGAILLAHAETWQGWVAGADAFAILFAAVGASAALVSPSPARRRRAAYLAAPAILALAVLAAATPSGAPEEGSRIGSVYLGDRGYPRFSIGNLVPEIDQIVVGTYLIPYVDPFTDHARAERVRAISLAIYRPMHDDPEYRALGSVMELAYEDSHAAHLYTYVPQHAEGERLAVLLFLHGSAGNFGAYFYLLRRIADRDRVILVCPTFGFGNWNEPGGVEAVERARRYATEVLPGDPDRVVLAGLSNGGKGVTRAAAHAPGAYAAYVFLSAVMEPGIYESPRFARAVRGRPVLVVHGAADERIALAHATRAAATFRAEGAHVTTHVYAGEDHFLLFSQPARVLADVDHELTGLGVAARAPSSRSANDRPAGHVETRRVARQAP